MAILPVLFVLSASDLLDIASRLAKKEAKKLGRGRQVKECIVREVLTIANDKTLKGESSAVHKLELLSSETRRNSENEAAICATMTCGQRAS